MAHRLPRDAERQDIGLSRPRNYPCHFQKQAGGESPLQSDPMAISFFVEAPSMPCHKVAVRTLPKIQGTTSSKPNTLADPGRGCELSTIHILRDTGVQG